MAKQLVVTVSAVDRASPTLAAIGRSVLNVGSTAVTAVGRSVAAVGRMTASLVSVRGLLAGVLAGAAVRQGVRTFLDTANAIDEIGKAARGLGLPVEMMSSWKYLADQANVSFDGLSKQLFTAAKNAGQFAATGGGRAAEAFKLLGVQVKDASGRMRPFNELLPELYEALERIPDKGRQGYLAAKIFGDGPEAMKIMAEGSDRLRALNEEAKKLGVIFTAEQAAIADEVGDAVGRVGAAWMGAKAIIVTKVGPDVTAVLNNIAEIIAAMPAVVGNVMQVVRKAFSIGEDGDQVRTALWGLATDAGLIAQKGTTMVLSIVAGEVVNFVSILPTLLWSGLQEVGRGFINAIGSGMASAAESLANTLEAVIGPNFAAPIRGYVDAMREGSQELKSQAMTTDEFVTKMREAWDSAPISGLQIYQSHVQDLGLHVDSLVGGMDKLLGIGAALQAVKLPTLPARPKDREDPKEISEWTKFMNGATERLQRFREEAYDTYAFAQNLAGQMAESISSGVATAIVDAITKTKSWGEAFREVGASILRMLSEMIFKMLVMRALSAALGGVFGTGVATASTESGIIGAGAFAGSVPAGFHGGMVHAHGIQRFAGGGMVGGFDTGRDSILAMLRPREFVVNNRGTANNDRSTLAWMNRGGRVQPEGSGGGVSITQNFVVTVNGGSTASVEQTKAAIKRAAADGLLDALRSRPGYRADVRGALM